MKILLDGRLISNNPTGISRYSYEMIKIYQKRFGYNQVYVLLNKKAKIIEKQFNYIEINYKPYNIFHFFFMFHFLKKINFDIYHSLFYSNSFKKKKNVLYVTTVHDLMYNVVQNFFSNHKLKNFFCKKYYDFIVKNSLKNSDYIISVSKTTQKDVQKIFNKDSVFIPEGINEISKKELKINNIKENDYFLYVGNSRPHKNLEFLLSAFEKSKTKYKLVIVGTNNHMSFINKKILFKGFVLEEELNWLYKNSVAFIFPSKYEGFGLPILEALAKGKKVISSTGGALKEFSDKLVFHFDPNNEKELIYLIENIDTLEKDKIIIGKELKKYNWENIDLLMNNYIDIWLQDMKENLI